MLMPYQVRNRRLPEERSQALYLILVITSYGLGSELQVPKLPVVKASHVRNLVVIINIHLKQVVFR